jgi:DNA polymerase-3 subunit chi
MAGEMLFYHLTHRPLEAVIPDLLEKCLERGWRATVRAGSPERVDALNAHLWTYRDGAFLPHGAAQDGHAARQPIYLTAGDDTPNDPDILFLTDGATIEADAVARYARVVTIFDGHDPAAVSRARDQWRAVVATGCKAVYWAQSPEGRWIRKAESGQG